MRSAPSLLAALFVLLAVDLAARAQEPPPPPAKESAPPAAEPGPAPRDPPPEEAPPPAEFSSEQLESITWRCVGPANMEGRIVDLAVVPGRPSTFYVAAASGGVWKTVNAGTTFEPVFQHEGTASIGSVAVAPSDPDVVWVGTGEANSRNSVTWGDGVYKSTDGGKSWTPMGLSESRHCGRIAIHPQDPDIVFVAALGRIWGPNPERGLFRTRDGGRSWSHVLALDDETGAVDVAIDPRDPQVVYAAAYAVRRDGFDGNDPVKKTGPQAGIYKSVDGGQSWRRLTQGLPSVACGRIGLAVWAKEPAVLFAVIETELTGKAPPSASPETVAPGGPAYLGVQVEDVEDGVKVTEIVAGAAAEKAGLQVDDVLQRIGDRAVDNYEGMVTAIRIFHAGDTAKVQYQRGGDKTEVEVTFGPRPPERAAGQLGGQAENRQDSQGASGFETGGIFRSEDRGETWTRINSLNPRPFYYGQIRVDPQDDQRLWVLGVQLYVSADGGKTFKDDGAPRVHVDHHALWIDPEDPRHLILGNDGGLCLSWDRGKSWEFAATLPIGQYYAVALDQRQPYRIYGGLQDNGCWGVPSRTRLSSGITNDLAFQIGGGDGFVCAVEPGNDDLVYSESQNGGMQRINVRTGETTAVRRPRGVEGGGRDAARYRFNWRTPFIVSPHNPQTLYFAANKVFRSVNRGESSKEISPEITLGERGSATALAESPVEEGVVWVGTDDGALQVTRNGGTTWTPVHGNLPGVPGPRWVSGIEASRTGGGTAYVVLDGHRSDDLEPCVFRTEDYGATFVRLAADLPRAASRVVREDPRNADLLYLGTETGVWVSLDRGEAWVAMKGSLPTVPVHDLAVHLRERELVAGTHGRGLWIADIAPLQELTDNVRRKTLHLFAPKDAIEWVRIDGNGRFGKRRFVAPNPEGGTAIWYWLAAPVDGEVKVQIRDVLGATVREIKGENRAGLNRVRWDLGGERRRSRASVGTYRVTVSAGGQEASAPLRVRSDPILEGRSEGDGP